MKLVMILLIVSTLLRGTEIMVVTLVFESPDKWRNPLCYRSGGQHRGCSVLAAKLPRSRFKCISYIC